MKVLMWAHQQTIWIGSLINSSAMFSLFLCPPLIILLKVILLSGPCGQTTPDFAGVLWTNPVISSSLLSLKQSLAL